MLLFYFILHPPPPSLSLPAKGVGLRLAIVSILLGLSLPARGAWERGSRRTGTHTGRGSTEEAAAPPPKKSSLVVFWLLTSDLAFPFVAELWLSGAFPLNPLHPPGRPKGAMASLQQQKLSARAFPFLSPLLECGRLPFFYSLQATRQLHVPRCLLQSGTLISSSPRGSGGGGIEVLLLGWRHLGCIALKFGEIC